MSSVVGGDRLDSLGMFAAAAGLPEQVADAVARAAEVRDLPNARGVEHVVVLGMGGSGAAGDLLAAVAGPFMPVPVVVSKNYVPPAFVGEGSLVFALSFSGNTEEVVDAASEAAVQGARIVAVCGGGRLGSLARSWGAPVIGVPDDIAMPRAGLGALAIPPIVVLEEMGLFTGASQWIALAVEQLRRRRELLLTGGNPAEELARRIGRTIPIVYGAEELGAAAAARWKTQFNENAKIPAFHNTVPELCHNEIVGWGQHGDLTRQVFTIINLRHDQEHPQDMRRFGLVSEIVDEVVARVEDVKAEGDGPLAQLLDLVMIGDFVSLHLAAQEGVDPGPIPILDQIKAALRDDRG
jgi:glucose/mannose-6-phosphate isomerase